MLIKLLAIIIKRPVKTITGFYYFVVDRYFASKENLCVFEKHKIKFIS